MIVLLTGCAGFIGMHVAQRLLARGQRVVGIDNFNDYYDPALKEARLAVLKAHSSFECVRAGVEDASAVNALFERFRPSRVVHLAAQAGVRYSLRNPQAYVQSNLVGFGNILEACRQHQVEHLVYASSSSVYGNNGRMPFSVHDGVDHPVSLYAATKKANELMAHSYSHLFGLPTTGLRYFTVYGPWGRPDMSPWLFSSAILEGRPIDVFNHGNMRRDFTYVDDIAEGTVRVIDRPAPPDPDFDTQRPDPARSKDPFRVYNIGSHSPIGLMDFIGTLERALGRKAIKNYLPMQPGDVEATFADVSDLKREFDFEPSTPLDYGLARWAEWFLSWKELKAGPVR